MNHMFKQLFSYFLLFMLGAVFVAAATLTPATGGEAISAADVGGSYTLLTGPVIAESLTADIGAGTIILTLPAGFEFETAASALVTVTKTSPGPDVPASNINNIPSGTEWPVTLTSTTATLTILEATEAGVTNSITFSGLYVRPTAASPLASGNITKSGTSTFAIPAATNYGTLTEVSVDADPVASFTISPTSTTEGVSVTFNASASTDDDGIVSYTWTFGDSSPAGSGMVATHTYADDDADDLYSVSLIVTDTGANTDTDTQSLIITNADPVVDANGPYVVDEGTDVNLTGSASDLGTTDSLTLAYAWDFDYDGSTFDTDSTVQNPTQSFAQGSYDVAFRTTDKDGGADTDTATVTVNNVIPTVLVNGGIDIAVLDHEEVSFTATFTDLVDVTHNASIDWGDGTVEDAVASAGEVSGAHTYANEGVYIVTVLVDDGDDVGSDSIEVTVSNVLPSITSISVDIVDEEVMLDNSDLFCNVTAEDADGDEFTLSYAWLEYDVYDDSVTLTETSNTLSADDTEHGYAYACQATVDDGDDGTDTDTAESVTIPNAAPVVTIISPVEGDEWSGTHNITFTATDADGDSLFAELLFDGEVWCDSETADYDVDTEQYSCELDTTSIGDGEYLIELYADDGLIGGASATESVDLIIDNTEPESWFTGIPVGTVIGDDLTLTGASLDGSPATVTAVDVSIDGGAWASAVCDNVGPGDLCDAWHFDWPLGDEDGVMHTVRSRATDHADVANVESDFHSEGEDPNEITFTVESLPKVVSVVTADTDGNQRIDRLIITFDEAIDDALLANGTADGWNVYDTDGENVTADYLAESVSTGAVVNDNIIFVNVAEIGTDDGDVTPWISYTQEPLPTNTHDLVGNELADGQWEATDGFSPPAPSGGGGGGGGGGGSGGRGGSSFTPVVIPSIVLPDLDVSTFDAESDVADEDTSAESDDTSLADITGGVTVETDGGGFQAFLDAITGAVTGNPGAGSWLLLVLLLAAIGGGFWFYFRKKKNDEQPQQPQQ